MQNYKKLGLKAFENGDFRTAKLYFNMAYEKTPNELFLRLIELCVLAEKKPSEASFLYDFLLKNKPTRVLKSDFDKLLNSFFSKTGYLKEAEYEDGYALNYKDFLESEKKIGFKASFERIIFSSKLVIDNRNDFLDFLEKLFDNGYKEAVMNYFESVLPEFKSNARFIRLQKRLMKAIKAVK